MVIDLLGIEWASTTILLWVTLRIDTTDRDDLTGTMTAITRGGHPLCSCVAPITNPLRTPDNILLRDIVTRIVTMTQITIEGEMAIGKKYFLLRTPLAFSLNYLAHLGLESLIFPMLYL